MLQVSCARQYLYVTPALARCSEHIGWKVAPNGDLRGIMLGRDIADVIMKDLTPKLREVPADQIQFEPGTFVVFRLIRAISRGNIPNH